MMTDQASVVTTTSDEGREAGSLAREMVRAYRRLVESYRKDLHRTPQQAEMEAMENVLDEVRDRALDDDPAQIDWWHLGALSEIDPERMVRVWQSLLGEALDELASGHRAAQALEWAQKPWERARFLAVRESFRREWQPRGGIEDALIDTLAMSYSEQLHWTAAVTRRVVGEELTTGRMLRDEGRWYPPAISAAEAVDQATAMVERFNRVFVRTLRALQNLRRFSAPVVIQNAGQVSVGGQQMNVVQPATGVDPVDHRG